MVSTSPPTSKSSSPFSNPLVTVQNAPITIGIIVTCIFYSFFNSLARSWYLSFFSHSFCVILWSAGTAKSTILQFIFFFFCWLLLSLVFWPRFDDPCVCRSPIGVYVCHFLGQLLGCAYTIYSYGQISISCTFPSGSLCRLNTGTWNHINVFIFFVWRKVNNCLQKIIIISSRSCRTLFPPKPLVWWEVFANGPWDRYSIPGRVIPKTQKNDTWCLLA